MCKCEDNIEMDAYCDENLTYNSCSTARWHHFVHRLDRFGVLSVNTVTAEESASRFQLVRHFWHKMAWGVINRSYGDRTGFHMEIWDITPYSQLKVNRRFGGICRHHLHCRRINWAKIERETRWQAELWFCISSPFSGSKKKPAWKQVASRAGALFLRNFGWLSTDYTALRPKR
jgi:hypothetical protein